MAGANTHTHTHNNIMQLYSIKKQKKELKRKRKRKIVRLERLRESISKRRIDKRQRLGLGSPR